MRNIRASSSVSSTNIHSAETTFVFNSPLRVLIYIMVNTRSHPQEDHEIPGTQGEDQSQQQQNSSLRPATPNSNPNTDAMPPRSSQDGDRQTRSNAHSSPTQSSVSLAGPGQHSRLLLSVATPNAREAYFIGLEKLNETFAKHLREEGVDIPCSEYYFSFY